LLIFSKLTKVSRKFPDEPKTAEVANYFYQAGLQAYRDKGKIQFSFTIESMDRFSSS
jgi:hypothetical protein